MPLPQDSRRNSAVGYRCSVHGTLDPSIKETSPKGTAGAHVYGKLKGGITQEGECLPQYHCYFRAFSEPRRQVSIDAARSRTRQIAQGPT